MEVQFGKRVFGGADWSGLESCGEQRMGSLTACEKHQAGDIDTNVRFLGTEYVFSAGIDPQSSDKEGHVKGVEVKAKAPLIEQKTGPVGFHLGAAISTGVKEEDGTTGVKLAGCGVKLGKKIGVSVFDNEISPDTAFFGKEWYLFIILISKVNETANGKTINSRVTCVLYTMIKK